MLGTGKHLCNGLYIAIPPIGDEHLGSVASLLQLQEKQVTVGTIVTGEQGDMEWQT